MRENISKEQLEELMEKNKKTLKDMRFYFPIIGFIGIIIILATGSMSIGIGMSSIICIGYLIPIYKSFKKMKEDKAFFESQKDLDKAKLEIKKYLNRIRSILKYLDYDNQTIERYTNKYLDLIEQAETLEDFQNIILKLRDDYSKYYEVLDEEQEYEKQQQDEFNKNYEKYYQQYKEEKYKRQQEFRYKSQKKYNQSSGQNGYTYSTPKSKSDYELKIEKYLKILELKQEPLNKKDLKAQYRKLIKKYHPDSISNSNYTEKELEKKSADINEAYDYFNKVLKD